MFTKEFIDSNIKAHEAKRDKALAQAQYHNEKINELKMYLKGVI